MLQILIEKHPLCGNEYYIKAQNMKQKGEFQF